MSLTSSCLVPTVFELRSCVLSLGVTAWPPASCVARVLIVCSPTVWAVRRVPGLLRVVAPGMPARDS